MPLNHPAQLCQDKFTTKDEELRLSIIISCSKTVNNSDNSSTQPQSLHFGPFTGKYKLFYIRIGGLALLSLLQFVGRLTRNKSSKARASRNMFTGLVLTVVNRAAFYNDKRKTRRKENVSSTLPRNKTKKLMTNGTKSNFTSHCRIAAKKLLRRTCFPNPFRACLLQFSDD